MTTATKTQPNLKKQKSGCMKLIQLHIKWRQKTSQLHMRISSYRYLENEKDRRYLRPNFSYKFLRVPNSGAFLGGKNIVREKELEDNQNKLLDNRKINKKSYFYVRRKRKKQKL